MSHDVTHSLGDNTVLLHRLRDGNTVAFDTLVRLYGASLIKHAAWIVGSVDTAEDVVQEVFLYLWRERAKIDSSWDIASYLYGLTRRRAINAARSTQTTAQRDNRWAEQRQIDSGPSSPGQGNLDDVDNVRGEIWNALATVSPRCREVFMLVWDHQLSYREVAHQSGLSEQTVRIYASRALKRLTDVLRERYRR